jgi:hypothetical protein
MEKKEAIVAVTYIICGALLQMFNSIEDGFAGTLITIFGFVILIVGLNRLKTIIDQTGQRAASLIIIAAIIGGIGALIDLIPFLGVFFATIAYLAAFVIQLIGLNQFKASRTFGTTGKRGFTLLIIAMVLSVLGALVGVIPVLGDYFTSILSISALILILFGWLKVQEDLAERFVSE